MEKNNPAVIDLVQDADGVYRDPLQPRDPEPIIFEFDKEPGDWRYFHRMAWGIGIATPSPILHVSGIS